MFDGVIATRLWSFKNKKVPMTTSLDVRQRFFCIILNQFSFIWVSSFNVGQI